MYFDNAAVVPIVVAFHQMPTRSLSRRRSETKLRNKTFVYFTDEERKLIDRAATEERRSVSSFVARAAIKSAHEILKHKH
jgi:uncharacterized protein (DUF1778 family)